MPNLCVQQGVRMIELTGEMEGSLCRVNRAIAEHRTVSTQAVVEGRLRRALQVSSVKSEP